MAVFLLGPDPDGNCCSCAERANPCDSCGEVVDSCAQFIPTAFEFEYVDYTRARDVINLDVANEWGVDYAYLIGDPGTTITVLSVSIGASSLNLIGAMTSFNGVGLLCASITVEDGTVLDVTYNGTVNSAPVSSYVFELFVYTPPNDYVTEYNESSQNGSFSTSPLPAGTYYLRINYRAIAASPLSGNVNCTITSTSDFVVNPVVALYDDLGTERKLEVEPKLHLPIRTEATGDWYASESAAQTVLDDPLQVSNCVGYYESDTLTLSFTAIDGGSTLDLNLTLLVPAGAPGRVWGSVNAVQGQTVTITNSVGTGTPSVNVQIYDYNGVEVENSGATASPWVSSSLPYTGRYIIKVAPTSSAASSTHNVSISSSGTMTVNRIQALYNTGLDCPARLDC